MSVKYIPSSVLQQDQRSDERFHCEIATTCQPPSSWRKDPWPGIIRDISTGGLSMELERRFEKGSGLAIELPTEDGTTVTVLARVAHVKPNGSGHWIMGCHFISELSDEEVQQVLRLASLNKVSLTDHSESTASPRSILGVLFQTKTQEGMILRWYVKQLDYSGRWPLEKDKALSMRINSMDQSMPMVQLKIVDCRKFGSYWIVDARLTSALSDALLDAISIAPSLA